MDADKKKGQFFIKAHLCLSADNSFQKERKNRGRAFARPHDSALEKSVVRGSPDPTPYYETRTSIFFGCASGSLVIVTCSTPFVSSAVIVFGSTVSGSEKLRETLP